MKLQELINKCKCGVYLTVNRYRDYYDTIEQAVAEIKNETDEETKQRILATGQLYELQFYPDTPVGSYRIFGSSLEEVLNRANESF